MDNQFFILEKLQKLTGIPLHYYGSGGDILFFSSGFSESDDPFHADASLKGVFLQASGEKPAIYLEQESIAYAHFSDKTGNVLIAGPVLCKEDVNATPVSYTHLIDILFLSFPADFHHPFTAPAITPFSIFFWKKGKTTSMGSAPMMMTA